MFVWEKRGKSGFDFPRVSAVLFYWNLCLKSAVFTWRKQSLDLDSAFGFGFHLRAAAQVALLSVILTEVVFCLKKLKLFNSVKANWLSMCY